MKYKNKNAIGEIIGGIYEIIHDYEKDQELHFNEIKNILSKMNEYKEIAQKLWQLLDDIDTNSDVFKPTLKEPNKCMAFYNAALKKTEERFKYFKSDGYRLYDEEEYKQYLKDQESQKTEEQPKNDIEK